MNRCLILIGLFTVLGFSISCKQKHETQSPNDSITILYIGDERIFHQDMWGMESSFWMFLPLVSHIDEYIGEIKPVLAESWTHTDDFKTWTVHLRKDVYWHDGVQMTANDIKFTIDLRKKALGNKDGINCELIDEFTFTLNSDSPLSELPFYPVYYPKHLLDKLDPADFFSWDFWKAPIGNGPYRFVRNVPKTMIEVEANPDYFGSQPMIKKAILKFSKTPSLQELLSGSVDVLTYVPRDFLFKIENDDRFKSYYWWGTWVESLFWNHNNPLFKEAKVRKALTMAIDRVELSKVLNYPDNIPITDILYSHNQKKAYIYNQNDQNDFSTPLPYDPVNAIKLFEYCGWSDSNSDGVLDKDGLDFKFELTVDENSSLMATYIQDKLKRIGIGVQIEFMERSTIKQHLQRNDYDALITRFLNDQTASNFRDYFGEDSYTGYINVQMDSIISLIENTGDIIEIDRLYNELAPIFERDIPITFFSPIVHTHMVNSKIQGLKSLFRSDPVRYLESLWIE
jgi:peptide/nickel transport system substrate-binding protein